MRLYIIKEGFFCKLSFPDGYPLESCGHKPIGESTMTFLDFLDSALSLGIRDYQSRTSEEGGK